LEHRRQGGYDDGRNTSPIREPYRWADLPNLGLGKLDFIMLDMYEEARSRNNVPTTFLLATKSASWSLPSSVNWLSCTPRTSEPMCGVSSVVWALPAGRRSGNEGSASLPCS
jgi:hypothetical protein